MRDQGSMLRFQHQPAGFTRHSTAFCAREYVISVEPSLARSFITLSLRTFVTHISVPSNRRSAGVSPNWVGVHFCAIQAKLRHVVAAVVGHPDA